MIGGYVKKGQQMIREYPDYYKTFSCIGGSCPDSCCIGWEVDIDEETFYYYRTVQGAFGKRLNAHMTDTGEDKYFPMTAENRCPFLNERNLCDIILNLGEESLCQVCTEYPRYYMSVGNYEQIDMSLSCMELGRLFFSSDDPVRYSREEIPGEWEKQEPEEEKKLQEILKKRKKTIEFLEDRRVPFEKRLKRVLGQNPLNGSFAAEQPEKERETDEKLLLRMSRLEVLDERWVRELEAVSRMILSDDDAEAACEMFRSAAGPGTAFGLSLSTGEPETKNEDVLPNGSSGSQKGGLAVKAPEAENDADQMEIRFEKLAVYFVFRYTLDAFPDGDPEREKRFIRRSLRFLALMCRARQQEKNGELSTEDIIDIAHLYSKEVEHSEENVEFMKIDVNKEKRNHASYLSEK